MVNKRGLALSLPNGFTLVELLITITILSVLSGIGFVAFRDQQSRGNDSRRKQDLKSIQLALRIYFERNGKYPCTDGWQTSQTSGNWISDTCKNNTVLGSDYISAVPHDPKSDDGNPISEGVFGYSYNSSATLTGPNCPTSTGTYYILVAGLERPDDPDADAQKDYKYCDGADVENSKAYVLTSQE